MTLQMEIEMEVEIEIKKNRDMFDAEIQDNIFHSDKGESE